MYIYTVILFCILRFPQTGKTTAIILTAVWETSASRHHGDPFEGAVKLLTSQHYRIEGFKVGSQLYPIIPRNASLPDSECKFLSRLAICKHIIMHCKNELSRHKLFLIYVWKRTAIFSKYILTRIACSILVKIHLERLSIYENVNNYSLNKSCLLRKLF